MNLEQDCGGFLRQFFVSGEVTDLEDFTEANTF